MDLTEQIRDRDLRRLAEYLLAIKLVPQDYLILDTETTGLDNCEIIELALIDLRGRSLFNERVKPINRPINPKAQEVHGITLEDLQGCRNFLEVWDDVSKLIKGKTLIIYNKDFDVKAIYWSLRYYNQPFKLELKVVCAMLLYSTFVGQPGKYNYKWQKLQGNHTALGDCFKVLQILKVMANLTNQYKNLKPRNPSVSYPKECTLEEVAFSDFVF